MLFGNFQIISIDFIILIYSNTLPNCVEKRCREISESNLNDTQCGFRPGRGNTDHISLSSKILRNIGTRFFLRKMLGTRYGSVGT